MEKRQIRSITAIQTTNTKKGSNERKVFEAGRVHERKILLEILQRERKKSLSKIDNKQEEIGVTDGKSQESQEMR